jgi:DNA gyrase/topoisomerase IV subunit A
VRPARLNIDPGSHWTRPRHLQTRNRLAEAIGELVKDERIKGISAIRDESSARGDEPVRLVTDLMLLMTAHGMVNRTHVDEIRVVGRTTRRAFVS